jgi:hypothetical protein
MELQSHHNGKRKFKDMTLKSPTAYNRGITFSFDGVGSPGCKPPEKKKAKVETNSSDDDDSLLR